MPYTDRVCEICGQFVQGQNFARHRARHHGVRLTKEDDALRDAAESEVFVLTPMHKVRAKVPRSTSSSSVSSSAVSADCIRNATLCILCRTSEINVPALSRYLAMHFSEIPSNLHSAIVVSAFTAVQKVAATYAEVTLGGDDDRTLLAKKAMSRWLHGLSAVEPRCQNKISADKESSVSSVASSEEVYSPSTNFLVDHHMPVPLNSAFHRRQLEDGFSKLDAGTDAAGVFLGRPAAATGVVMSGRTDEVASALDGEAGGLSAATASTAVDPAHVFARLIQDDDTDDDKAAASDDVVQQTPSGSMTDGQSVEVTGDDSRAGYFCATEGSRTRCKRHE